MAHICHIWEPQPGHLVLTDAPSSPAAPHTQRLVTMSLGGVEAAEKPQKGLQGIVLCVCTLSKPIPAASFFHQHKAVTHKVLSASLSPNLKDHQKDLGSQPGAHLHKAQGNISWSSVPAWALPWVVPSGHQQLCRSQTPQSQHSSSRVTFGTVGSISAPPGSIYPKQPQIQLTD